MKETQDSKNGSGPEAEQPTADSPRRFPFAPAKGPRRTFPGVDPAATAAAIRAHNLRGLDFFFLLLLHELSHAVANVLCGRICSIQIENSGFAFTCHDRDHKLERSDEAFVAALGGAVHVAFISSLALPSITPAFLRDYVYHAINRDARLAGVQPEVLRNLISNEVLPHISEVFIGDMKEFAENVSKESKRDPNLCYFDVTDEAEALMPEVFTALKLIRTAINMRMSA